MMAFAERFEELRIWVQSRELANRIYGLLEPVRDYGFRDQIRRAAVSVMNNIAEGFERRTKKDFAHFLDLAKGSAGEVRSMLYLAEDQAYIKSEATAELRDQYEQLALSIGSMASKLRSQHR